MTRRPIGLPLLLAKVLRRLRIIENATSSSHSGRVKPLPFAFLAGLVSACGFQPIGLWPLIPLGVAVLLWLVARAPRHACRKAIDTDWHLRPFRRHRADRGSPAAPARAPLAQRNPPAGRHRRAIGDGCPCSRTFASANGHSAAHRPTQYRPGKKM